MRGQGIYLFNRKKNIEMEMVMEMMMTEILQIVQLTETLIRNVNEMFKKK